MKLRVDPWTLMVIGFVFYTMVDLHNLQHDTPWYQPVPADAAQPMEAYDEG